MSEDGDTERTPGSDAMWSLSEAFGVVPARVRANSRLGAMIQVWWATPRWWGCPHAALDVRPTILLPFPNVWCAGCAQRGVQHGAMSKCAVCGADLRKPRTGQVPDGVLWVEDQDFTFVGRLCPACNQREDVM